MKAISVLVVVYNACHITIHVLWSKQCIPVYTSVYQWDTSVHSKHFFVVKSKDSAYKYSKIK